MILERDDTGADIDAYDDDDASWDMPQPIATGEQDLEAELQAAVGLGNDPGLELLVDLAKKGEADPWDLDVVSLTDRYLEALDEQLDARDLGRVARLIFYAACLIHLKAQAMAVQQRELDYDEALEQALADELDWGEGEGRNAWTPQLRPGDQPLDYGFLRGQDGGQGVDPALFLSPREQPLRSRGLTLVDLIHALRDYDDRLAHRELLESEPDFDEDRAMVECVGSSHQDDLEGDIVRVRELLWDLLGKDQEQPEHERVELTQLTGENRTRAAAFLALLFLVQDGEVYLEQTEEEFYGPLFVVRGPHFGEVRAGVSIGDEDEGWSDEDEDDDEEWEDVEGRAGLVDEEEDEEVEA